MNDIMLDLETMGQQPNAAIVAIGAVEFDPKTQTIGSRFYTVVDLQSEVDAGAKIDASTALWWMRQGDAARGELVKPGIQIRSALDCFTTWLKRIDNPGQLKIWGNGSDFDNVILASAYRRIGAEPPWKFWNNRCYRTMKSLHPEVKMERQGTHHDALDDAESQALHLMAILRGAA